MEDLPLFLLRAGLIGVGATLVMDVWAAARKRLFRIPSLDYALVGRWLAGLPAGRLIRRSIATDPRVPGEAILGWSAHYLIGVTFAGALLAIWGQEWARRPTPGPALLVGLVTVAAPFLILQPGMGAGLAASRTPRPGQARLRSLTTHLVFGAGLYGAALLTAATGVGS